jgi:hypothetical protein
MSKKLAIIAAGAALVMAGPAFAQGRGNNGSNGTQTREQARQSSQGPDRASTRGQERSNENSVLQGSSRSGGQTMRDRRRQNSQGAANASDRGRAQANQNSAIAGVQPGMMVHDRGDRMVGTVSEVRRSPTGVVIAIVVVLQVQINGSNVVTLPAGSFTVINNVVVVNQINISR